MLLDYDDAADEVTATFVAIDGETIQMTVMLDTSSARKANQAMFGVDSICSALDDFSSVTDSILETCRNDLDSKLCTGSIAQASDTLASFCSLDLVEVLNTLGSAVGRGPALAIPLGVVVRRSSGGLPDQSTGRAPRLRRPPAPFWPRPSSFERSRIRSGVPRKSKASRSLFSR